jgi:hypothetical protein
MTPRATSDVAAAFVAASLLCSPALAQDTARGEELYQAGVQAYAAGDLATACPRFEASFAADRQAAPLFMWAKCAHKEGKLASALERYEEVLRLGGLDERLRDEAAKAVSELGPRVPKLELLRGEVSPEAIVRIDGVLAAASGKPVSLDPGPHTLRVELAGHEPFESTVTLEESTTSRFELRVGPPLAPTAAPAVSAAQGSSSRDTLVTAGFVAAGVSLAGFAIGGVTGGVILDACGGSIGCATRTDDDPSTGLRVTNGIGFGLGLAGAATSAVLFVLAATSDDAAELAARLPLAPAPPGSVGLGLAFEL